MKETIKKFFSNKWEKSWEENGDPKSKLAKWDIPQDPEDIRFFEKYHTIMPSGLILIGGFFIGLVVPDNTISLMIRGSMLFVGIGCIWLGMIIERGNTEWMEKKISKMNDRLESIEHDLKIHKL